MDAFEKWANDQWYLGKGENAPNPSMILIAKSYEEEARKAFRAGMRAAAEIVRDGILDDDDIEDEDVIECINGVLEDTAADILAEADK